VSFRIRVATLIAFCSKVRPGGAGSGFNVLAKRYILCFVRVFRSRVATLIEFSTMWLEGGRAGKGGRGIG